MWNRFLFITLLSVALQLTASAQVSTAQLSLKDTTMNLLYRGMVNKVMIRHLPGNFQVKFNGVLITPGSGISEGQPNDRLFDIIADREGTSLLQVFDGSKEVYKKSFDVKKQPGNMWVRLGKIKDSLVTTGQILMQPYLTVDAEGSFLNAASAIKIQRYHMIIQSGETIIIDRIVSDKISLNGKLFGDDIIAAIRSMRKGDKIMFEDIKVRTSDGAQRSLGGSVQHTIK